MNKSIIVETRISLPKRHPNKNLFPLVSSRLTSREEPVGVLNDGFNDADDLQGNCGHHFCDVSAADR